MCSYLCQLPLCNPFLCLIWTSRCLVITLVLCCSDQLIMCLSELLLPCKHTLCLEWCTRSCFVSKTVKKSGVSVVHPLWRFKNQLPPNWLKVRKERDWESTLTVISPVSIINCWGKNSSFLLNNSVCKYVLSQKKKGFVVESEGWRMACECVWVFRDCDSLYYCPPASETLMPKTHSPTRSHNTFSRTPTSLLEERNVPVT